MRTVSYRLADLQRAVIPIGYCGENEHTRVIFDCKRVFDEYPSAVSALTVQPPSGEAYPAVIVRDGESVYWDVYDSDLAEEGRGEAQLTFSQSGVVVKSFIFRTIIERSIMGEGEIPEPLDDFLARAGEALTAIPQTIDDVLEEAKESGEFDGEDGFSPEISITDITGGHRLTVTTKDGSFTVDVMDGEKGDPGDPGDPGQPGSDGVSPTVSISKSGKTTTVTITDANGAHTATILDGEDGTTAIDDTAGAGDTDKVWSADKSASEVSRAFGAINVLQPAATSGDVGKFLKAKTVADGKVTEYEFGSASGGGVSDVQVNGTSVVTSGVASVPVASNDNLGVVKTASWAGVKVDQGVMNIRAASESYIKPGTNNNFPIASNMAHAAAFYGLAKAAGDSTQASSSNAVGIYTESAKSSISEMLNGAETVSGTTPSITAKPGVRYVCGEVSTLDIVAPVSGDIEVIFDSGSTATVLTVTPPTGVTAVKWANGFDPTSLDANTRYDLIITDGEWGLAASWA